MESILLIEDGEIGYMAAYLLLSVFLGLAAALVDAYIARNL